MFSSASVFARGGGFDGREDQQKRAPVDEYYELGKTYFNSPQANGSKLEYCVLTADIGLKKLSRKSVRSFRNGSESNFTGKLLHCPEPALRIMELVPAEESDAILYYLNKRFKLSLKDG